MSITKTFDCEYKSNLEKITLDTSLKEIGWMVRNRRRKDGHLSTRVMNRLLEASAHIKTLGDLKRLGEKGKLYGVKRYYGEEEIDLPDSELKREIVGYRVMLRGFGEKGLSYLNNFLSQYGIEPIQNKKD